MQNNSTLNKVIWITVGVILLVIIALCVGLWGHNRIQNSEQNSQNSISGANHGTYSQATNSTIYPAAPKQLVSGFPNGLIDTLRASVQSSYLNMGKGYDQYTANLSTSSSIQSVYNEYLSKLSAKPYSITSKKTATSNSEVANIYAANGTNLVSVVIAPDPSMPKTTDITITYENPVTTN